MKALLVLAVCSPIVAAPLVARADDPKLAFEKYTLPNGLEVILAPDPSIPLVAVNVWYHVGSGDEVPGKSGFAHLFEHMMFQGSKNVGSDKHFEVLRKLGSDEINGTTNSDRTNYFEVVPANQLETGLWLESDRMSHLLDLVDKDALANQIDVVRNERRQRYDNAPYNKAKFALQAALYPEGHPYRYFTIGKHEDLVSASVDDVKAFYKTWYVPANATIALVGDFDVATAKQLVTKWFGSFPASKKPTVVTVAAPAVAAQQLAVEDPFAKLRQITFAWHSPAKYAAGDAELAFVADALTREGTGRLYKLLVYAKQLAQSVRADQDSQQFSGTFQITVDLRPDADAAVVQQLVLDEVAKVTREPLAAKEMARLVAAQEVGVVRGLESVNGRANRLQQYNHFLGDPGKLTWDLDRFRTAQPEAVRDTAAKYLQRDRVITITTTPEAKKGGAK
ncbi:MAG: pitrilysin family protein [Deltaproteobacteria bacterium]